MKRLKGILLSLIVISLCFTYNIDAQVSDRSIVSLNIAFDDIYGMVEYGGSNASSGYLYDYIGKVKDKLNCNTKFIPGNTSECKDYLDIGVANVVCTYDNSLFADDRYINVGVTVAKIHTGIYTKSTEQKLYYDNTDSLSGLIIGTISGDESVNILDKYYNSIGIKYNHKEYASYDNLMLALDNGDIEAVYLPKCIEDDKYQIIASPGDMNISLFVKKEDSSIASEIVAAITELLTSEQAFEVKLQNKYFGDITNINIAFTETERNYINTSPEIKVYYIEDYAPYSYYNDEGILSGVLINILDYVKKQTDISIEYEMVDNKSEGIEKIKDVKNGIFAGYLSYDASELNKNIVSSESITSQSALSVGLNDYEYSENNSKIKIGMIDGNEELAYYANERYDSPDIYYYASPSQCLKALENREIDLVVMLNSIYLDASSKEDFNGFNIFAASDFKFIISYAFGNNCDKECANVIDKCIMNMSPSEFNTFLYNNVTKKSELTITEVISKYSYIAIRFVIMAVILIIGIFVLDRVKKNILLNSVVYTDPVTTTINWNRFKQLGTSILKNTNKRYALIEFDIDKFKLVNDMYGIVGGNRTLKYVATEVQKMLRKDEIVARFYADLFCVLIYYDTEDELIEFVEKTNSIIKESITRLKLVTAFGIYRIGEEDIDIDMMSDRALLAKKSIKGNRINYYAFYDYEIREKVMHEKEIESLMDKALENDEFEMYLQPQYSSDGRVIAAEALARWNDPSYGVRPPSEFIDIFEKNSFILKLDLCIWEQACRLIRKWIDEGKTPIPIAINVSRTHLNNFGLIDELTTLINRYSLPLSYIELEITENSFLENQENAIKIMEELHKKGFIIAMDDFGSGYSSLNMINLLPIDILKIDREFLRESEYTDKGRVVISDIIGMAKHLNMTVVCEGIETEEQGDFLKTARCDRLQGFYYSKPKPVTEVEKELFSIN